MREIRDIAAKTRAAMFSPPSSPAAPTYYVCVCGECGGEFSSQVRTDRQCRKCSRNEAAMHGPYDGGAS
jgi:hypothetical protein